MTTNADDRPPLDSGISTEAMVLMAKLNMVLRIGGRRP